MAENYFTGHIEKSQQKPAAPSSTQPSTQPDSSHVQKSLQEMTLNQETKPQQSPQQAPEQQHQKNDFVDVQQVQVQKEQIDEEKFIQSNPTIAAEQKQLGNQKYTAGQFNDALAFYRKSLQYTGNESEEDKKFRSVIYSNIGLTFMKMRLNQSAIEYFQNSLKLNDKYTKARTNLAQCYQNSNKLEEALEEYKKVLEINPNDAYVKQRVIPLEIKVKDLQQKRKEQVMGGLKNIGNSILGYFGMSLDNFKLDKGPGGGYNISFKQ